MIRVRFDISQDRESIILSIDGHAEAAPAGHDEVCALATMQARWLARMATKFNAAGRLRKEPKIILENGKAEVVCKPKEGSFFFVQWTYICCQEAFADLQEAFPEFISVKKFSKA